jgi:hypothetical protein
MGKVGCQEARGRGAHDVFLTMIPLGRMAESCREQPPAHCGQGSWDPQRAPPFCRCGHPGTFSGVRVAVLRGCRATGGPVALRLLLSHHHPQGVN